MTVEPLFRGTAADCEDWLATKTTVDLVSTEIVVFPDTSQPEPPSINRDALADAMCRHSFIADWYEKADLVLADLGAVTATPEPTAEQVADLAFVRYATVAAVLAARAALVAETGKDGTDGE